MTCYSPLKGYENKEDGGIIFKKGPDAGQDMEVACNQCIGCRISKSKEWAARIVHESQMHQDNCFVTLTYDEENLPYDTGLNKAHYQKFMKRLRKKHTDKKIRYFHCGEYGETTKRPHYHACLFGIDFEDRKPYSANNDVITDISEELQNIWGKGFCTIGELNYQTAAYTSRYILKKVTGNRAKEHYQRVDPYTGELYDVQPEYITMSLGRQTGQGIGGTFYEKYKSDFWPSDECPIPGRGVYKKVPKYYEKLYAKENPEELAKIKRKRTTYLLANVDEYSPERLETKYKVKKAQLSQLKRNAI